MYRKLYIMIIAPNKAVKPFACGLIGRSALRACSGMASPFLPDQSLHAERRLPGRLALQENKEMTQIDEIKQNIQNLEDAVSTSPNLRHR